MTLPGTLGAGIARRIIVPARRDARFGHPAVMMGSAGDIAAGDACGAGPGWRSRDVAVPLS